MNPNIKDYVKRLQTASSYEEIHEIMIEYAEVCGCTTKERILKGVLDEFQNDIASGSLGGAPKISSGSVGMGTYDPYSHLYVMDNEKNYLYYVP